MIEISQNLFLPISRDEMHERGWDAVDIALITGDAYVDHPGFGTAVIGRVLEAAGYRVGIIAMPDWQDPKSITVFGEPRLFFGISSGNVDSMLSRYTAFKKTRRDDPYAPGGKGGHKPSRALIVYSNLVRQVYKKIPIVIGGIEASMRRFVHYDFWSDKVRRSILEDTRASVLVYGMSERAITTVAERIASKSELHNIPGTVILSQDSPEKATLLPSEESMIESFTAFNKGYGVFYRNQHRPLVQPIGKRFWIQHPQATTSTQDLDRIYALPFTRQLHHMYDETVPALEMIRDSITAHRGCVSGCGFCSLNLHQGRRIVSRSPESVVHEIEELSRTNEFKGHITDIGGPSANMYGFECSQDWICSRESCLFPDVCPNLRMGNEPWLSLLDRAKKVRGVNHVTVGSGLRYDVFMRDPHYKRQLKRLAQNHVSGQLKIAPEHVDEGTLRAMRKKPLSSLYDFIRDFKSASENAGKKQYLVPYVMSCHPGSSKGAEAKLRQEISQLFGFSPEQAQAFIPLPMTLSSVIYYTGRDPLTNEKFAIIRDPAKRKAQHQILMGKGNKRGVQRKKSRNSRKA
ncbi:YgiQ family radical SAM protein [candidate division KSB1 bacterium]|nr:YgiQ family radical SAM protein [candidate division KSB1 bacterium]